MSLSVSYKSALLIYKLERVLKTRFCKQPQVARFQYVQSMYPQFACRCFFWPCLILVVLNNAVYYGAKKLVA